MIKTLLILSLATSGGWPFGGKNAPMREVRAERLRTPNGMPDVYVVYDTLNKVTCFITHSSEGGGGIFCMPTPQNLEKTP